MTGAFPSPLKLCAPWDKWDLLLNVTAYARDHKVPWWDARKSEHQVSGIHITLYFI